MMPRGDRRAEILAVAERLFASGRFHEVTLEDVAQEAKVGKGTIYRYFEDKEDLFVQTVTSGLDDLCDLLHAKVPEEAPFREQLLSACGAIHSFFRGRHQALRMMHTQVARLLGGGERFRQQVKAHRQQLVSAMAAIIAKGVAEGRVRRDVPPEILASVLLGMLHMWVRQEAGFPKAFRAPETIVDLFCRGAGRQVGGRAE